MGSGNLIFARSMKWAILYIFWKLSSCSILQYTWFVSWTFLSGLIDTQRWYAKISCFKGTIFKCFMKYVWQMPFFDQTHIFVEKGLLYLLYGYLPLILLLLRYTRYLNLRMRYFDQINFCRFIQPDPKKLSQVLYIVR